ncbi:MAG TPA: universal stress protein [Gemmatimonadaceae bacterium]|nr:universal stress protein [Gemmatimonadaceae bacterium]
MTTLKMPSTTPELGVRASRAAPIIIATDGRDQSDPALVLGRLVAGSPDALRIVTVLKTVPVVSPDMQLSVSADVEAARRAEARRSVIDQMQRWWSSDAKESGAVELYDGDPATVVTRLAHESAATMIVAGLGRHRVMDRVFGDETALRLIRLSDVPVLAVATGATHAPRRIVVAADFSETSLRAARLALEVAAPEATVYLAHVAPRDSTLYEWNAPGTSYRMDAGAALRKTQDQLRVPPDMTVQRVLLQGDPATELLAFASSVNADLIATGSHGHGFVARLLIGSVTTRIVRCATCSVLTVPHAAAMTRVRTRVEPAAVVALPRNDWSTQLDDFTRKNMGRKSILEVDDPEIGAQAQQFDYPLLGASFDSHDQRVELMFGQLGDTRRHLSRGIGGVTGIDVLRDAAGRDVALRVVHGAGQTLLHFTS